MSLPRRRPRPSARSCSALLPPASRSSAAAIPPWTCWSGRSTRRRTTPMSAPTSRRSHRSSPRRLAPCSSKTRSRCIAATCWSGLTIPTRRSRWRNAEANLATAIRKVQGLHATDSGLGAQIAARAADQGKASAADRGGAGRRRKGPDRPSAAPGARLDRCGIAGRADDRSHRLQHCRGEHSAPPRRHGLRPLRPAMAAVGDRDANRALIANSTVDNNPEVLAARAALAAGPGRS